MKLLPKVLLPFLVTGFCLGFTSCTDNKSSEISTPVVGSKSVQLNMANVDFYIKLKLEREFPKDDTLCDYYYRIYSSITINVISVSKDTAVTFLLEFSYAYINEGEEIDKLDDLYFTLEHDRNAIISSPKQFFTFPVPINELTYFNTSIKVTGVKGSITY